MRRRKNCWQKKDFTKSTVEVHAKIQSTVKYLEGKRCESNGNWLLGSDFGRADAICTVLLQWIIRCNEYGAIPINISPGLLDYLEDAKSRQSYQK